MIEHTKDLNREQFEKDEVLLDSIMFRFIQISEHIKKLSLDFKDLHNNIPWINIIGLRNRIVHEYGNVDLNIVYDAVKEDIYLIHRLFKSIKKEL
ncbi:MAG: HepT-like ribonuclease domain-containing protein [Candidatus Izemoplasmatales bacterium]|nr:HepT-like ribonuclease domain-containing protein [Candidatus Izemoplasmatales bacterium]